VQQVPRRLCTEQTLKARYEEVTMKQDDIRYLLKASSAILPVLLFLVLL
jgi:hypothetical protein